MANNARDAVAEALVAWERDHTFSNLGLDSLLSAHSLESVDGAFATRLFYGVLEHLLTIDWLLGKASKTPLRKCHPTVRAVLRTAVYQLVYLDKIPASAAVNEAVGQVKRGKQAHAAGFVNGVLRSVDREHKRLLQSVPADLKGYSILHSVPFELLSAWSKSYGRDHALALASAANEVAPTVIRLNTLRMDAESFEKALSDRGITATKVPHLDNAYCVEDPTALKTLSHVDDLYYFQDTASQWACMLLESERGDRVLDVCAAPGGKSFTTALMMENDGSVESCDIHDHKVTMLTKRSAALGLTCVTGHKRDASTPLPKEWCGVFDRVICDVPCSGFGVIRRRPEIRYKALSEFETLPALQYQILCEAAKAVKPGGVLQYSTCTLRPEENEYIVKRFLAEHPSFLPRMLQKAAPLFEAASLEMSHYITLMPHLHGTDGFFIASFRKESEE